MMKENNPITEHLRLLEPYSRAGGSGILTTAVTIWLVKDDLSVSNEKLEQRLKNPDPKLRQLLDRGVTFSSRTAQVNFAAGLYKQKLSQLVESARPVKRNVINTSEPLLSRDLERVSSRIADFALQFPFEEGLIFLAELTKEWMVTCSEEAVRQDIVFIREHWDAKIKTDRDINDLLLRWFILSFPY
jgi:hypothetical protein